MKMLRAILIALLAISIPLPAIAAAFGATGCMNMQTEMSADMHADMASHDDDSAMHQGANTAASADTGEAASNCCCDDCINCEGACATASTATFNNPVIPLAIAPKQARLNTTLVVAVLPAHGHPPIRPPGVL